MSAKDKQLAVSTLIQQAEEQRSAIDTGATYRSAPEQIVAETAIIEKRFQVSPVLRVTMTSH